MDFQLSPSQRALKERVRAFAERELAPFAAKWDEEELSPEPTVKKAAAEGLMALTVPKEYGGDGLGAIEAVTTIEELSRVCANTAEIVFDSLIGPVQVITAFGTEAQKQQFLPAVAKGELMIGIAISEEHAGSGASDMYTRARIEGDEIVIDGVKTWVEDTHLMDWYFVYAKFNDEVGSKSIGGVLVHKSDPGFELGPPRKKMGLRGCQQADITFAGCRVPKDRMIVGPGEFKKLMAAFNLERCGNSAMAVGIAQGALDAAIAFAKERTQFGKPLCEFQGLQWKIARMAMKVDVSRLLIHRAIANAESGFPSMLEASMAKVNSNEMTIEVTNDALQIFGARGYLREWPLERMVRDARAWAIAGGTVEIQLNGMASQIFDRRFSQRPPP